MHIFSDIAQFSVKSSFIYVQKLYFLTYRIVFLCWKQLILFTYFYQMCAVCAIVYCLLFIIFLKHSWDYTVRIEMQYAVWVLQINTDTLTLYFAEILCYQSYLIMYDHFS